MQIQKVVIKKQELEKKVEEGLELEGYTEILQDIKSLLEKAISKIYHLIWTSKGEIFIEWCNFTGYIQL